MLNAVIKELGLCMTVMEPAVSVGHVSSHFDKTLCDSFDMPKMLLRSWACA